MIYITGDTHGNFDRFVPFCKENDTTKEDLMIVLGDAGINFGNPSSITRKKRRVEKLPLSFLFVRGNHEMRPENCPEYMCVDWHGGTVYIDPKFPSLHFAIDGEIYDLGGFETLVIGGAYSVDKELRLAMEPIWGKTWWANEQVSKDEMDEISDKLQKRGWKVDMVLSHTSPLKYEPRELFLTGVDQSAVDKTMEIWLDGIEDRLDYKHWWFGHYHGEKDVDRMTMLFKQIRLWPGNTVQTSST